LLDKASSCTVGTTTKSNPFAIASPPRPLRPPLKETRASEAGEPAMLYLRFVRISPILILMPATPLTTDYQQVAEAVLRFSPRQQALLAGRIQKNLGKLVDATSKQIQRRVSTVAPELTEVDITREVESVRNERYARRK